MQWVKNLLQHQAAVNDVPATYGETVVLLQAAADPSALPPGWPLLFLLLLLLCIRRE